MILYTFWRSTTAYRVRIALNHKGVEHEVRAINLDKREHYEGDYKKINPVSAVPALVLPNGETMTQSMAILDFLDTRIPLPALYPTDAIERSKVQAAALLIATDIHPVNNLKVVTKIRTLGHDEETIKQWMNHWMIEGFTAFQELIDPDTPFCFGETPTMADICLIPQLYNATRWGVDMRPFERLQHIEEHCLQLDAFDRARPENQVDAETS